MTRMYTKRGWGAALLSALVLAACSDSPTGVEGDASAYAGATVTIVSGNGQTGQPGVALEVEPAVQVKTRAGTPAVGVVVRFAVTRGGGGVERTEVTTNESGIATAGKWTLGAAAGPNEVQAQVLSLPAVRFTAQAVVPPSFNIAVRYIGAASARQQQAVAAAVARWQSVITTDLPNVPMNTAAGSCAPSQPALNETVDDLLIYVEFKEIDGVGKVLGSAGPCYIRTESGLPIVGYLQLDGADLKMMETSGSIDDVVLHEIGHILGIGTLWSRAALVVGAGTDDPMFTGTNAVGAYGKLGGTQTGVPVENTGETGTRDGHWRETIFGNELMTGYISGTNNPLSALTIASLKDLGYGASFSTASTYMLGGTSGNATESIDLHGRERVLKPKYQVDRHGRADRLRQH